MIVTIAGYLFQRQPAEHRWKSLLVLHPLPLVPDFRYRHTVHPNLRPLLVAVSQITLI